MISDHFQYNARHGEEHDTESDPGYGWLGLACETSNGQAGHVSVRLQDVIAQSVPDEI